ncbi:MAG: hypothetical protein GY806_08875 [Gammaproteobacteria bacterium]|nr:hypothetical protein [Gammaproteobacteria bacterium]
MIEQQINLYQDRFRQKRQFLTAAQIALLLLIVISGMAAYSVNLQMEMDSAVSTNLAIKQQQQSLAEELAIANSKLTKLLADTRFDDQITDVSREIRARNKIIDFVDGNRFGSNQGFSSYLISLSNLHMENIWLNEIKLSGNFVRIRGSSLNEELVPTYFDQFSRERAFAGNRFDVFRLQRDDKTAWKVDFEIASEELLND